MTTDANIGHASQVGSSLRRRRVADICTVGVLFFVSIAAVLSRHLMYI